MVSSELNPPRFVCMTIKYIRQVTITIEIENNKLFKTKFKFLLDINKTELKYNMALRIIMLLEIPNKNRLRKATIEKKKNEQFMYFNF